MVGQALGAQEPAVNDPPFVLSAGLEVQERRSVVIEFIEESQRVLSGRPARIDRLRQDPFIPLLKYQDPCFALFHRRAFPPTGKPWESS